MVRLLTEKDLKQYNEVQAIAFNGCVDENDTKIDGDFVLGFFENEKLLSCVECHKSILYFGDIQFNALCLSGVASRPEARGKGAIKAIFNYIHYNMSKDYEIGFLQPFSVDFYEKLGYTQICKKAEVEVDIKYVSKLEKYGSVEICDTQEKYNEVEKFVIKSLDGRGLTNSLFNSLYSNPYETAKYTYYLSGDSGKIGSAIFFTVNRSNSCVIISNIFYSSRKSLEGMLSFLSSFSLNCKKIVFENLPQDSEIICLFSDCLVKLTNSASLCILNIDSFINKVGVKEKSEFTDNTIIAKVLFNPEYANTDKVKFLFPNTDYYKLCKYTSDYYPHFHNCP